MAKAPKTRNLGTMTEAAYWARTRAILRRGWQWWGPARQCKENAKKRVIDPDSPRRKWAYLCAHCSQWFKGNEVQIDHIIPAGKLNGANDLPGFLERLNNEDVNAYQLLCKPCHKIKSNDERKNAKEPESTNSDIQPGDRSNPMGSPYID